MPEDFTGAAWVTWSYTSPDGPNCFQFARVGDTIAGRDTKFPEAVLATFTPAEMDALVSGVKDGEFDHLIG